MNVSLLIAEHRTHGTQSVVLHSTRGPDGMHEVRLEQLGKLLVRERASDQLLAVRDAFGRLAIEASGAVS